MKRTTPPAKRAFADRLTRLLPVVLNSLVGVTGCSGASDRGDTAPNVGVRNDALYLAPGAQLWPGARTREGATVPVCWEPGTDTGTLEGDGSSVSIPDGPAKKAIVQAAIESSWGHAANIRFTWNDCPDHDPVTNKGKVAIHWETKVQPQTNEGYDPNQWTRMRLDPTYWKLTGAARHEFGHALGFAHEQERPDNWDGDGNWIHCGKTVDGVKDRPYGTYETLDYDGASVMDYCAVAAGITLLSNGDIAGVQNAYGRKPGGSIVGPQNRCVDIPLTDGTFTAATRLQLYNCNGGANQEWQRTADSQLFAPAYPSKGYMDVAYAETGDNGVVQAYSQNVPTSANQQWSFNSVEVQGLGFQCVTVDSLASGQVLKLQDCDPATTVKWTVNPSGASGTIQQNGLCWDIPFGTVADHNPIQLYGCHGGDSQKFNLTSSGQITFGGKCVDVRPDDNTLQLFSCKQDDGTDITVQNQHFNLHGPITGIGGNCLDDPSGNWWDNVPLQTYHCHGGTNQDWDYYFD